MRKRYLLPMLLAATALAVPPSPVAVDFASEVVGSEPKAMVPVAGHWAIVQEGGHNLLKVDGSHWRMGQRGEGLAEKARILYGQNDAEFRASIESFPNYPCAIARDVAEFQQGEVLLRFKPLAGREDQAAGILFDLKPSGDYLALRANALEDNLILWRVVKGRRTSVHEVSTPPPASGLWHDLRLVVKGRSLEGYLDGKLTLKYTLDQAVSGRVGIWSKADSVTLFDGFSVRIAR
jgi:hypothetical protein